MSTHAEGDRCFICGHWWWNDGKWHTLAPILLADGDTYNAIVCPFCAIVEGIALPLEPASHGIDTEGTTT